jgi:hypothetical protein
LFIGTANASPKSNVPAKRAAVELFPLKHGSTQTIRGGEN